MENACLEEAEDAIETICCSSSDNVMQGDPFMCIDLPVDHEAKFSVGNLPKPVELTMGRNTMKQITCVAKKML